MLVLISLRNVIPTKPGIWLIMLVGAIAVLLFRQISWQQALNAIDLNVMGYLLGVFILGQALEESGLLDRYGAKIFKHSHSHALILFLVIMIFGLLSALLMNDTLAIMATPLLLHVSRNHKIPATPLLLALAYAITIGSVMTPIGNPQNLLIAINAHMALPFIEFAKALVVPTLINLGIAFLWVLLVIDQRSLSFSRQLSGISYQCNKRTKKTQLHGNDKYFSVRLCISTQVGLCLLVILISLKIMNGFQFPVPSFPFSFIALIAALPIILFSDRRWRVVKNIDWHTLIFFMAMFVLMQSVWDSGFFQDVLAKSHIAITSVPSILGISVIMSQLISNVPLVALYLPVLMHHGVTSQQLMALAAGSTIAGNFLLIGAASNIIIVQNAEKRGYDAFGFWQFAKYGVPLGIVNMLVYWVFSAYFF